ncbi:MAG: DUF4432 family protein, partial [Aggregatilineales bacterium]
MTSSSWLHPEIVKNHSLDMRQFMDFQESVLADGQRVIQVHNSSGLTFTLLPDRGLDIWSAHYNGMPLTWVAPGSPHLPDYGQSWLTQFNGGLLTTCGLMQVGPPETDAETGEFRDLHGNFTRLRAQQVYSEPVVWLEDESRWRMRLNATLLESRLHGEQYRIERSYTLYAGDPAFTVTDRITNLRDDAMPLMLLYHCNFGYPMIREKTELLAASQVYARDDVAARRGETWHSYEGASTKFDEEVFFHHVNAGSGLTTRAALLNEDVGVELFWNSADLPYLTQWKNTRQGMYVCGVEPGNCIPEGINSARDAGRLRMIKPGETQTFSLTLRMLDNPVVLDDSRTEIGKLVKYGIPVQGCKLDDF